MRGKTVVVIGVGLLLNIARCSAAADESAKKLPSVAERRSGTAIIIHRGSLDLAVENTLAAIEASFLTGADGVEIDIAQTSDGILVLMHDPWVDRVLDGYGNVAELTYAELLAMRYRDPYGLTRVNEHVPTLRDAFELIDRYNGLIHLDIKVTGIDGRVHDMLVEMDLLQNVVTVNDYNSQQVRADARIQVLPSQGALIHGNNDYDADAVRKSLARRPKGTLLVDDARCAAAVLGRPSLTSITEITLASPLPRRLQESNVKDALLGPRQWTNQLDQVQPVQEFALDETQSRNHAAVIRRRAALARSWRPTGRANATIAQRLEMMIQQRSLHLDGAWQGLDGSAAAQALVAIRPDAKTVEQLDLAVQRLDPRLTVIETREELPTWLRQSGAWWDFRIKSESIAVLGKMGGPDASDALWQMLQQPTAEAELRWRELHWDAARALTTGSWALTPNALERLLTHKTSGVRRAGCVYLVQHHDRPEYQNLLQKHVPWLETQR